MKTLFTPEDNGVSFVTDKGYESRFVRLDDSVATIHLSSQNTCNKFCGQNKTLSLKKHKANMLSFLEQAQLALRHYHGTVKNGLVVPVKTVVFHWSLKGDPMTNNAVRTYWKYLVHALHSMALSVGVKETSYKLSTTMPENMNFPFEFEGDTQPEIHYCLYSTDNAFRKRWVPGSLDPALAFIYLKEWQEQTKSKIVVYWNRSEQHVNELVVFNELLLQLQSIDLDHVVKLVRYNPCGAFQKLPLETAEVKHMEASCNTLMA